jgi:type I restriction enzyme, S subunit
MNSPEGPAGWTKASVRDLIHKKYTGPSPTCDERVIANEDEWGILKTTAVTWNGWNELAHKVPPESFWNNQAIEVHAGDVIVTKAGPRHRVGVVVHVRSTQPHLMVSGKMIGLRPKRSVVLPQILANLLSTRSVQEYLNARTTGMAESQTNFADEALLATELTVPPMSEQHKIAETLDALDEQMAAIAETIRKSKAVSEAVLDDLIQRLPEDCERRLGEVLVSPPRNGYSPVESSEWAGRFMLGLGCLTIRGFGPRQLKYAPAQDMQLNPFLLQDGDVLMSRSNTRELVGLSGVFRDIGYPCFYPDLMMRLAPSSEIGNEYLAIILNTAGVRRQIMNLASGTSGSMVKINRSIVQSLRIPVPSLAEQQRIVTLINQSRDVLKLEAARLEGLRNLKAGLVDDLLTGRVRVATEVAL